MEGLVSGFGLGYGAPSINRSSSHDGAAPGIAETGPTSDVDALMRHCLQQCLDYHEQRMKEEAHDDTGVGQIRPSAPQFVSSATSSRDLPAHGEKAPEATHGPLSEAPSVSRSQQFPTTDVEVVVPQEAMAKAQSIAKELQKFVTPQPAPAASQHAVSLDEARAKAETVVASWSTHQQQQQQPPPTPEATVETRSSAPLELPPAEHLKRRRAYFQREQERFHKALMRNFAYVARREEQRLQDQLQQIETQKKYAEDLRKAQMKQLQERKKQMMLATTAGLGTKQQRKVEQRKRKMGHTVTERKQQTDNTVAVYLMGLQNTATEDMIRPLFQSYGTLQKVHFYRDKSTRRLKGDCLLVYQLEIEEKRNELLESVCGQMNGAELPDGTVLQVQPASSEYKRKTPTKVQKVDNPATSGCTRDGKVVTTGKAEVGQEEELDDFFASLA